MRRGGLTLLATLVSLDGELWKHLPPASAAQAVNVLNAVAAADQSKQLRELAQQLAEAVSEAVASGPSAPAAPFLKPLPNDRERGLDVSRLKIVK